MTDCQAHAQQQEQQQQDEAEERQYLMRKNHGKMIGLVQMIRDSNKDESYIILAVNSLLEVLKEHEDIKRRYK
jgi:hypothetical protein